MISCLGFVKLSGHDRRNIYVDSAEYKAGHSILICASYKVRHSYSRLHKGYKAGQ